MAEIKDYEPIVGRDVIAGLERIASRLNGRTIQNVNSTAVGGGVAEILIRMIPLLKNLGVAARWNVIKGNEAFFRITKKMHNALHGAPVAFTAGEYEQFLETNRWNAENLALDGEFMFIHDPQPVALVAHRKRADQKWIWRCHIDFSDPDEATWAFLKTYVERYDVGVFSAPSFARDLAIPQALISPSIDPLSDKNRELPKATVDEVTARFGIDPGRPIVTQISRFDYLKDPVGVVRVFRQVRRYLDAQLVLAGSGATDDPEGEKVFAEVREAVAGDRDIFLLLLPPGSDIEINALQRASSVILQKSLREGFGLTVSEALWKAKPVIAGAVGGIPLQITHKYSGLLTHTLEGTAFALKQLLQDPAYAKKLGENGREHIKRNFLITRHLRDYLLLFLSLVHPGENVVYL